MSRAERETPLSSGPKFENSFGTTWFEIDNETSADASIEISHVMVPSLCLYSPLNAEQAHRAVLIVPETNMISSGDRISPGPS